MNGAPDPAGWWQDKGLVQRFGLSLLELELRRIRKGEPAARLRLSADTRLDGDGIDLDSLDRLKLTTALCSALDHASVDEQAVAQSETTGELLQAVIASMTHEPQAIRFLTSGSRGAPKGCVQPIRSLMREAAHWAGLLSGSKRLIALVPAAHIYGFIFTILVPHRLSVPVIDRSYALAPSLAADLRPRDIVISHPAFWATAGTVEWPHGIVAISSGGQVDRDSFARVVASGDSTGFEVYGSSETGGIGLRMASDLSFTLLPWFERREDALFDRDSAAIVEPPDALIWRAEHLFDIGERLDGAVNVAGNLVKIASVESVISACPGVDAVRVRMMRPDEGERLKAFVVARDGVTVQDLRAWCRSRLEPAACPASFRMGAALPMSETGKDSDW